MSFKIFFTFGQLLQVSLFLSSLVWINHTGFCELYEFPCDLGLIFYKRQVVLRGAAGNHVLVSGWQAAFCMVWKSLCFLPCHSDGCLATADGGGGGCVNEPTRSIVAERVLMQRE